MNNKAFSVSEISRYIATLLKRDPMLTNVYVEGEVSNFRKSAGNVYFSLKDESASIKCIIFRNMEIAKTINLSDGDRISLRASVITYDKGGYYQLLVKEVINTGIGDIYRNYELLKEKLMKQGYFYEVHKKPIPKFPENIGIITSPNGAAIRDIITTIQRRFKVANLYVYPAIVQGVNAPESLINGLEVLDNSDFIDLIIIGRGGGSFEDLNCFNDEELLNKIFNAKKPIVSAVGHEVDNMLSDFVSDLRAPTPTAAAELVTPNLLDLTETINKKMVQIDKAYRNFFIEERKKLDYYGNILRIHSPMEKILKMKKESDRLKLSIDRQTAINFKSKRDVLDRLSISILKHNPKGRINILRDEITNLTKFIRLKVESYFEQERLVLENLAVQIDCHNDSRIKKLGYIRVSSHDKYVNHVKDLKTGQEVKLHFEDGTATTEVRSIDDGK